MCLKMSAKFVFLMARELWHIAMQFLKFKYLPIQFSEKHIFQQEQHMIRIVIFSNIVSNYTHVLMRAIKVI